MSASDSPVDESSSSSAPPGTLSALGLAAIGSLWRRAAGAAMADTTTTAPINNDITTPSATPSTITTTSGTNAEIAAAASNPDAAAKKVIDAHPFFQYYASLVHQQNMMQDMTRAYKLIIDYKLDVCISL